ncbi:hypothetical protein ACFL1G_01515 [Planctomycetota bacterium]
MARKVRDPQIYISKKARELFTNMKNTFGQFKHMENKDLFFLAFIFGYLNKKKKSLTVNDRETSGFTRDRYLSDADNAVLKAVAIQEKNDIGIIDDIPAVYAIAEAYANGGVEHLKKFIFDDPASTVKKFSLFLKQFKN